MEAGIPLDSRYSRSRGLVSSSTRMLLMPEWPESLDIWASSYLLKSSYRISLWNHLACSSSQVTASLKVQYPFSAMARSMTLPPCDVPKSIQRFFRVETEKEAFRSGRRGEWYISCAPPPLLETGSMPRWDKSSQIGILFNSSIFIVMYGFMT